MDILKTNYEKKGGAYCACLLGRSITSVHMKSNKLNLKTNKSVGRIGKKRGVYMREVKEVEANKLIVPITKEACYVLGFLWADGWITKSEKHEHITGCQIVSDDYAVIKNTIFKVFNWKIYYRNRPGKKPSTMFRTNNSALFLFLKTHDYDKKSWTAPSLILSQIPEKLRCFWWRGYFDGDGCFYNGKVKQATISGAYSQDWKCAQELCLSLGCSFSVSQQSSIKGSSSRFRLTNIDAIKKFGRYIYSRSTEIGLVRKLEKFQKMVV